MGKSLAMALSILVFISGATTAAQDNPSPKPSRVVHTLMSQKLPEYPGKVAQVLTVEYSPGYEAVSHTHPGPLFGYVLEGTFTTEVEGQTLTTYTHGQTFFEPSGAVHRISRNASATQPLKLLIFILAEAGKPIASPVKQ